MREIKRPLWLVMAWIMLALVAAVPPHQDQTSTPGAVTEVATIAPFAPAAWVSPTPDATGAIIVIVQPGESLWVIAARAGLSLPDLLTLNNLTEQSIINPGDTLIIAYVTPEAIVVPEEITPTATPPPPTARPTEARPEAAVCLTAFDDLNRNGLHDTVEPLRAGVAFTVYNSEAVVANYITDGRSEPKCLRGLAPGEYRVTRSIVPGETLTTDGDWSLTLTAGGDLYQAFGSATGEAAVAEATAASLTTTPSPPGTPSAQALAGGSESSFVPRIIGVAALFLGGLLLLGAVLILLVRQSRNKPATPPPDETAGERRFRKIDELD